MQVRHVAGAAVLVLCGGAGVCGPAWAGLGGATASVAADSVRMGGEIASTRFGSYVRHDLTRPNGGLVKEFTNADGQVFAVAWSGPGKPDLRSLLGPYFASLQPSEGPGRSLHALRRPLQVDERDLQLQTGGHLGWFRGLAFIRSLAPDGVGIEDVSRQTQP